MSDYNKAFDELLAEVKKTPPRDKINNLNDDQIRFIKDCKENNVSYNKMAELWNKHNEKLGWFKMSRSLAQKIVQRYVED
jgi:hypothetical protein